jgi:hypothetical protein
VWPWAVCLNPLLLLYLWQGVNAILLVAGMAVAAVALAGRRVVLAGLALGATLAVKLLLAPMVVLFGVWLAAEVRRGRLDPGRLGLIPGAYPISGHGLAAQLLRAGVLTDPFGPAPLWATTLPAAVVDVVATAFALAALVPVRSPGAA